MLLGTGGTIGLVKGSGVLESKSVVGRKASCGRVSCTQSGMDWAIAAPDTASKGTTAGIPVGVDATSGPDAVAGMLVGTKVPCVWEVNFVMTWFAKCGQSYTFPALSMPANIKAFDVRSCHLL